MEKKNYEKPVLKEVKIVAEETVALGCWRSAPSSC